MNNEVSKRYIEALNALRKLGQAFLDAGDPKEALQILSAADSINAGLFPHGSESLRVSPQYKGEHDAAMATIQVLRRKSRDQYLNSGHRRVAGGGG